MSVPSSSVAALRERFGDAILRHAVLSGDTIVYVRADRAHEILAWLRDDPGQGFNYLTDVTAVEYRDAERPLEVVWQLRSLDRKADLRVKAELEARGLRIGIDAGADKLGAKIRNARMMRPPYVGVIGEKEVESGSVTPRSRDDGDLGSMTIAEFRDKLLSQASPPRLQRTAS